MRDQGTLDGQHVVVVGGGSGIGFAVADACLGLGARVTIASTNEDRLTVAAAELGRNVRTARVDVTDEGSVRQLFDSVGTADHVVTSAGDWPAHANQSLSGLDFSVARSMFDVRFWGALAVAKHAARHIARDGSLVLTNGMISVNPRRGSLVRTAVAGSIEHVVRALAIEMAPVRVNVVCPAITAAGVWEQMASDDKAALTRSIEANHLISRPARVEEVVQAYLYLLLGGYTTGQVIRVEGGSTLGG